MAFSEVDMLAFWYESSVSYWLLNRCVLMCKISKQQTKVCFCSRWYFGDCHLIRGLNLAGSVVLCYMWPYSLMCLYRMKTNQEELLTATNIVQHLNFYCYLLPFSCQVRSSGIHSECLDYNAPEHSPTGAHLSLFGCHGQGGNQVR